MPFRGLPGSTARKRLASKRSRLRWSIRLTNRRTAYGESPADQPENMADSATSRDTRKVDSVARGKEFHPRDGVKDSGQRQHRKRRPLVEGMAMQKRKLG